MNPAPEPTPTPACPTCGSDDPAWDLGWAYRPGSILAGHRNKHNFKVKRFREAQYGDTRCPDPFHDLDQPLSSEGERRWKLYGELVRPIDPLGRSKPSEPLTVVIGPLIDVGETIEVTPLSELQRAENELAECRRKLKERDDDRGD